MANFLHESKINMEELNEKKKSRAKNHWKFHAIATIKKITQESLMDSKCRENYSLKKQERDESL